MGVGFELEPGTTGWDDFASVHMDTLLGVESVAEISAWGSDDLRDDDTFCAVDDEGSGFGHHRDIAHEDFGTLFDDAGFLIENTKGDLELA